MDMLKKVIEIEITKSDISEAENSLTAVVSTEDRDRDNEVIKLAGMNLENYRNTGMPLLYQHRPEWLLGKGIWIEVKNKRLVGKWKFHMKNDLSREVYELVKDGYLTQFSIGFRSKSKTKTGVHLTSELGEVSVVTIPSNVNTEVLETRVHDPILRKELNLDYTPASGIDYEKLTQAIRDGFSPESLKEAARAELEIMKEKAHENNGEKMIEVDLAMVKRLVKENILEVAIRENPELAKRIVKAKIKETLMIEEGKLTGKVF